MVFLFEEKKSPRKILADAVEKYNIPNTKINGLKNGADWINDNGEVVKNNLLTKPNNSPYKYAYCSDTRFNNKIIKQIKEVDLLYHEATFMHDLIDRAEQTGHSTTLQAAQIAKKANVKKLLIGHFSQRYKDLNDLLIQTKKGFSNVTLSYAGLVIDFQDI